MTLCIAGVRVEKVKACSLLHTRSTQYETKNNVSKLQSITYKRQFVSTCVEFSPGDEDGFMEHSAYVDKEMTLMTSFNAGNSRPQIIHIQIRNSLI